MPVEHVSRTVTIDDLAIVVTAWRYVCDTCGRVDAFADVPMPEGHNEWDAQRRGWRFCIGGENDRCKCPSCVA